jgi:O-antigen/teichoic acid export membrane protein
VGATTPSLARNAALKLASEGLARGASLALVLVAARTLGEAQFGLYSYGLALGFATAQLADLGLPILMAREVAARGSDARGLVRRALRLKLALSAGVLACLSVSWLASDRDLGVRASFACLGGAMLLQTYVDFAAHVHRGRQELDREALLLAGSRLGFVALGVAVLAAGGGLLGLSTAVLLAIAAVALLAIRGLARDGWLRPSPHAGIEEGTPALLGETLPLGLAIVLSVVYTRLALFALDLWIDETAVARFSAAQRLVEPSLVLPAAIMAATFPAYVGALRTAPDRAARLACRSAIGFAALGSLLGAGLWAFADPLIRLLYGDAFAGSVPVLRVLALSAPPTFLNLALTQLLIARGQQRHHTAFVGGMLVLHGGLCTLFVPAWGAQAAAASVVAAELLLSVCCIATLLASRPHLLVAAGGIAGSASPRRTPAR